MCCSQHGSVSTAAMHSIFYRACVTSCAQIDEQVVLRAITPAKDVDGLHPANVAALCTGRTRAPGPLKDLDFHVPCTPQVMEPLN